MIRSFSVSARFRDHYFPPTNGAPNTNQITDDPARARQFVEALKMQTQFRQQQQQQQQNQLQNQQQQLQQQPVPMDQETNQEETEIAASGVGSTSHFGSEESAGEEEAETDDQKSQAENEEHESHHFFHEPPVPIGADYDAGQDQKQQSDAIEFSDEIEEPASPPPPLIPEQQEQQSIHFEEEATHHEEPVFEPEIPHFDRETPHYDEQPQPFSSAESEIPSHAEEYPSHSDEHEKFFEETQSESEEPQNQHFQAHQEEPEWSVSPQFDQPALLKSDEQAQSKAEPSTDSHTDLEAPGFEQVDDPYVIFPLEKRKQLLSRVSAIAARHLMLRQKHNNYSVHPHCVSEGAAMSNCLRKVNQARASMDPQHQAEPADFDWDSDCSDLVKRFSECMALTRTEMLKSS